MGIAHFQISQSGLDGVTPRVGYLFTNDSVATVLGVGYLNTLQTNYGYSPKDSDIIAVTTQASSTAAHITSWYGVTHSGSNWSLTDNSGSPGSVVLPTVLNQLIVASNTTGGLTNLTGTAFNLGSIQAGQSGTAGTLASFPATASKGSLVFAAVANTGNTVTTVSNVAMGQASVVSIPDPANAVARFLVGATATPFVSGNFPQNSGTAGLMVDSGLSVASVSSAVTQLGALYQVSVTLNTAAMVAAYGTPQVLIAAVSGKVIVIHSATVYTASTGNTAYATGTAPIIQYGVTAHGAGTIATGAGLVAGDITAATSQIRTILQATSTTYTGITNTAVAFSNATGAYTGGTGTNVVFNLVYELITATI